MFYEEEKPDKSACSWNRGIKETYPKLVIEIKRRQIDHIVDKIKRVEKLDKIDAKIYDKHTKAKVEDHEYEWSDYHFMWIEKPKKHNINIFHTSMLYHKHAFSFTSLADLWNVYGEDRITKSDFSERYVNVACFEHRSFDDDKDICEKIFHDFNSRSGLAKHMISQEDISSMKTHTSMSVGDIIQIDGKIYYCNDFGFVKIELDKAFTIDGEG